ncbi:MAG: hypothetical protein E7268_10360 [Lachnospiraceae bacterium]|nr:hypothetical protein [Lachnospiraceae bacterium]
MKKLAVMFPGVGYTMDFPLLYYASFWYEAKGYEQIHMKYNSILFAPNLMKEEKTLKARDYIWEKVKNIDFSAYDEVVFFSKSFGTAEAGILAERLGINPVQIYLTPVPTALPYIKAGDTVVIGTADEVYPECKAYFDEHGIQPMYIEEADHSLEVKGKLFESLEILKNVMKFVTR